MPIESIIMSVFIVAVFGVFAVALAYGQYQTRNLRLASEKPASVQSSAEESWRMAA